jgi:hypothetical protein
MMLSSEATNLFVGVDEGQRASDERNVLDVKDFLRGLRLQYRDHNLLILLKSSATLLSHSKLPRRRFSKSNCEAFVSTRTG